MIDPFVDHQIRDNVISFGLSSYGYDIRVSDEFKIFTNVNTAVVAPKNFDSKSFVDYKGDVCIIPPNSFVTGFDAEWEGNATLEISNTTPLPCRIYANEGIAQVLFFESDETCALSYKDKQGKYQGQEQITLPRLDGDKT